MNLLWSNIFRKKAEEESLSSFLGTVPVFADLGKKERDHLEALVHVRRYTAGEVVFEEGDTGSGMYVIRSGRVQIFYRHLDGREEELAQLGPGDFFGETTLMADASRTASARAQEGSELLGLFRSDLLETAQRHPTIACKLLLGLTRIVSERLQVAGRELRRLRATSPEEETSSR